MARVVITEERYYETRIGEDRRYKHYTVRQPEEQMIIMSEHFGARNSRFSDSPTQYYYGQHRPAASHKGPYLHATVVAQQQEENYYQKKHVANKSPFVQNSTVFCKSPYLQPVTVVQPEIVLPVKKHNAPIDCNEAAKLYGGVVFTEYGRKRA